MGRRRYEKKKMDYSWRLYALLHDKYSWMCKKESKKITIGSSVDKIVKEKTEKKKFRIQNVKKRKNSRKRTARNRRNREGNRHQVVMLIMTLQI